MGDPHDELASDLVLALRRALAGGVTLTAQSDGYRVLSADAERSLTVFADGSTSELSLAAEADGGGDGATRSADFWDFAKLRSADQRARTGVRARIARASARRAGVGRGLAQPRHERTLENQDQLAE